MAAVFLLAVCAAGKGLTNTVAGGPLTVCQTCASGFFGDINRAAADYDCKACPGDSASAFNFRFDKDDHEVAVSPITEPGAISAQQCLLKYAQILVGNW